MIEVLKMLAKLPDWAHWLMLAGVIVYLIAASIGMYFFATAIVTVYGG